MLQARRVIARTKLGGGRGTHGVDGGFLIRSNSGPKDISAASVQDFASITSPAIVQKSFTSFPVWRHRDNDAFQRVLGKPYVPPARPVQLLAVGPTQSSVGPLYFMSAS